MVVGARIVAGSFGGVDLIGREAEEEEVFRTDGFPDLDIGPVESADGESAIHGELHVAGAGGFFAGEGDLLGEIGGGVDTLAEGDIVIGEEDDAQTAGDIGIGVDDFGNRVDELDDELGHEIAGSSFAAEQESAWNDVDGRVRLMRL